MCFSVVIVANAAWIYFGHSGQTSSENNLRIIFFKSRLPMILLLFGNMKIYIVVQILINASKKKYECISGWALSNLLILPILQVCFEFGARMPTGSWVLCGVFEKCKHFNGNIGSLYERLHGFLFWKLSWGTAYKSRKKKYFDSSPQNAF